MNNVILTGRLVRDAKLSTIQSGTQVAKFTMAVDKGLSREKKQEMESKNIPTADFIPVVVWGKLAENVANYTNKGKLVGVQGRISTRTYDDKEGIKRYVTEVVANNVEFLEFGDKKESKTTDDYDGFHPVDIDEDNIPF